MSRFQPEATYLEPIVGWRCWRVLSMQTLSEGRRYRLCAASTAGLPKVWEPRAAVAAHCASSKSRHEAPHRSHECGIYAYESQAEGEGMLATMWGWYCEPRTMWAFGRVSLWGRVIEHELGWRAQYAYPYEVTVFTGGKAASAIGREYAIDVEQQPLSALRAVVNRYPDLLEDGRANKRYDDWYRTSIYGIMDSSFLWPYHQEVCRKLDKLSASVSRLERRSGLATKGGDDA
jgi:hypothetical protein